MASKIWRNLIRTAAAACFVVGSSAQAGGVFYQSDFDPLDFIVKNILWVNVQDCFQMPDWYVVDTAPTGLVIIGRTRNSRLYRFVYSSVATLTSAPAMSPISTSCRAPTAARSTDFDPTAIVRDHCPGDLR